MIAYKCDRCESFFEALENQGIELRRRTAIPLSDDTPIHLCPNCFGELKEWLGGKIMSKREEEKRNENK